MHSLISYVTSFAPQTWALGIYVLAVLGIVGIMVGLSWVLGGRARGHAKTEAFESGVVSVGSGHLRISAKFYLVAMFFVIFDLEAVFLYAWAVSVRDSGWPGFIEAAIFISVLLIGLVYLWRLGALDWAPTLKEIYARRWIRQQDGGDGPGMANG